MSYWPGCLGGVWGFGCGRSFSGLPGTSRSSTGFGRGLRININIIGNILYRNSCYMAKNMKNMSYHFLNNLFSFYKKTIELQYQSIWG